MAAKAKDRNCTNCGRGKVDGKMLLCRKLVDDAGDIAYPETMVRLEIEFAENFRCRDWASAEKE